MVRPLKKQLSNGEAQLTNKNNIRKIKCLAENEKFESGNNAAGTRARKALAELGKAVKARRNEITETKNARAEAKKA